GGGPMRKGNSKCDRHRGCPMQRSRRQCDSWKKIGREAAPAARGCGLAGPRRNSVALGIDTVFGRRPLLPPAEANRIALWLIPGQERRLWCDHTIAHVTQPAWRFAAPACAVQRSTFSIKALGLIGLGR